MPRHILTVSCVLVVTVFRKMKNEAGIIQEMKSYKGSWDTAGHMIRFYCSNPTLGSQLMTCLSEQDPAEFK